VHTHATYLNLPFEITFLFLLSSAEQQIDVTINALSTTGEVLYTRTLEGVTFRQAYQTTATGTFFSAATAGSMMFDTTLTNEEIALDPAPSSAITSSPLPTPFRPIRPY